MAHGFHTDVDGIGFKQPLMGVSKNHENNAGVCLATSQGVRLVSGPRSVLRRRRTNYCTHLRQQDQFLIGSRDELSFQLSGR